MTPEQARHLAHSREMAAAAEAATDPADKAVYRLLQKAYEQLSGPGRPLSTKLLHRDLDTLKADTEKALAAAASGPFPPDPNAPRPAAPAPAPAPAPAGSYFTVDRDGKAKPATPEPQTTRPGPVWKAPVTIEF